MHFRRFSLWSKSKIRHLTLCCYHYFISVDQLVGHRPFRICKICSIKVKFARLLTNKFGCQLWRSANFSFLKKLPSLQKLRSQFFQHYKLCIILESSNFYALVSNKPENPFLNYEVAPNVYDFDKNETYISLHWYQMFVFEIGLFTLFVYSHSPVSFVSIKSKIWTYLQLSTLLYKFYRNNKLKFARSKIEGYALFCI